MISRVFFALSLIIWLLFVASGIDGYFDIAEQNVPGYPNSGQIYLYVVIPVGVVILLVAGFFVSRRWSAILGLLALLTLLAVFPYAVISRGGV